MQGGRGRGDPFFGFGDPFAGFSGMPSLFGERDPFDDPFFTHPMGGMLQPSPFGNAGGPFMGAPSPFGHAGGPFMGAPSPFGHAGGPFMGAPSPFGHAGGPFMGAPSPFGHAGGPFMGAPSPFGHAGGPFMGASPFGPSFFGPNESHIGSNLIGPNGSPFMDTSVPIFHENRQSLPNSSRGPVIEELHSDNEKDEPEDGQGRELKQTQSGNQVSVMHDTRSHPQAHGFTFQSSTVTHGGSNGAYYTSSTTRRAGSDGLKFEEHKEADSTTGQAAHRISRGIHHKGHTLSRHLKSDGQVDTMQMLHNINEDELTGFEEAWKGKARKHLPGWTGATNAHEVGSGGWALPSTENPQSGGRRRLGGGEHGQSSKVSRY